jgi:hypothetical protein
VQAVSITHSKGEFAGYAKGMCHIVICGLSGSTIFFHIISKCHYFQKKVTEHKMCILIFSTNFV